MGYGSQILHMIFFIIFILISFHCTHFLIVGASLNTAEKFNVDGLKEGYYGKENHIEKVSGEDENEEKEALILEKFRALLGLKRVNRRKTSKEDFEYGSPSPSPSPTVEAPAPAPVLPVHVHSHTPSQRHRPILRPHKIHKEERDKGRVRRIIVPVLVSAGGAAFVASVIGLIWGCLKFRKQRRSKSTVSIVHSTEGGSRGRSKYLTSQTSVKKVSSDPGPDLFYLESLETALEPQPLSLKQSSETVNTHSNQNPSHWTLHKVEEEIEEILIKSESDNVSCSAVGEIVYAHDTSESIKCEADDCSSLSGNKVIAEEAHSSDDESFHSFCNSHSSNVRLSDASAGSLSDTSEIVAPNVSNVSPFPVTSPMNLPILLPSPDSISTPISNSESNPPLAPCNPKRNMLSGPYSSDNQKTLTPLLPPPPPPCIHVSPSHSASRWTQITSKVMSSSTLPNLSLPRNSDSSSGSNQTPQRDLPPSPPNPLNRQARIPPPPCPPPFSRGSSSSLKGPPPPPSQLPQYMPLGKDGAPLPKLKPLHWDKVRAAPDRSMVWDKLRSSSFEFDEEMIESLFGYNLQKPMKNDEAKSKSPSPTKHVLELKRLQNITILSKALNVSADQVCSALMQGGGLSLQQLEALVKMELTKEEEAKLRSYKGDINELGSAEKFVKAVLNIPFAFLRIEVMLYRETFEDEVVHLRKSFSMLEEACKELRSSRLFLKLLEAVLKTGNRMNVGTIRGGAKAFKLDALLKLADVKGTDGKTTLLHFVVQEIVQSEGIKASESIMGKINQKSRIQNAQDREECYKRMGLDLVSGLCTELCNVKKTATVDLDVLASSVSNLSDGMTKLRRLVCKDLFMEEKSVNFVHSMRSFLNYAEKNLKELQEDEHRVLLLVRAITEYFHGNVSKDEANPLQIFVIVRDFLGMLDHVCKELRSLKVPSNSNHLSPF